VIVIHLILYSQLKNPAKNLRFLLRLKWFVLIVFLGNAFVGDNDIILFSIKKWDFILALSYEGILIGAMMCARLISMILITQVVRFSMKKEDFIEGLTGFGLSRSTADIIETILDIVSSEKENKRGGGNGKGKGKGKGGNKVINDKQDKAILVLLKGRVGSIPQKLIDRLEFATSKFKDNPNATLGSSALAVTLIRMVKIAPGLPIAPGHKNILIIPVFIYGIEKTEKPFAGLQIGLISGILHFSMGFGKYGALSIIEFVIVGGILDLFLKLPIKKTNLLFLMTIGAIAGAAKVSFEIFMIYIFLPKGSDLTLTFFIIYLLPLVISQIAFGLGSGFISRAILTQKNYEQQINS
jgi:hypothetical protein